MTACPFRVRPVPGSEQPLNDMLNVSLLFKPVYTPDLETLDEKLPAPEPPLAHETVMVGEEPMALLPAAL